MLKDNISETPALIMIAKHIGIDDVVLTNLIHVTNEWQEKQRVFGCDEADDEKGHYKEILNEAEIKARELKIKLRLSSLSPNNVPVCEENPLRNIYISVDGEISPCVYLYPPVPSPFKRIFCGDEYRIGKASFGNIFCEPFRSIWNNKRYAEFRDCFMLREKRDLDKLRRLETVVLPEPPEQCKTCHKMLGV